MRFRPSTLLSVVLLLSVILGIVCRRRSNNEILRSIYSGSPEVEFESDISSLRPFLDKMNSPPTTELLYYLENWIPRTKYASEPHLCDFFTYMCEFQGLKSMEYDMEESVPDYAVLPFGFFPIGDEGTGWKYAYCVHDRAVYLLGYINPGDVNSTEHVKTMAHGKWSSLNSFLLAVEQYERERAGTEYE